MAQAGRTKGRNGRRKKFVSQGMVETRRDAQVEARIREGVVASAVEGKERCPVCGMWSEGWYISRGRREWKHFGRRFDCVERLEHIEPEVPASYDASLAEAASGEPTGM